MPPLPTLQALPLGGLGRFGGNLMVYETEADLIAVDCGVNFPTPDEPGVKWVLPDISYLRERLDKLRAIVITHGHEDHIGALPFVAQDLRVPIYATGFTLGLIEHRLRDAEVTAELRELQDNVAIRTGQIEIQPIPVTHSIPGAVSLALHTAVGTIVHTSDFKLDPEPLDGRLTHGAAFEALGRSGVVALFSDSTNAHKNGHTWSEQRVRETLIDVIGSAARRVVVTTFASHVHRLQAIIEASVKAGRRVMPIGRSVQQIIDLALARGFLRAPRGVFLPPELFAEVAPRHLTVIASGCQGEAPSAMARIAHGTHADIRLERGDCVVLSSRWIPGNERVVGNMVDALLRRGIEVVDDQARAQIHTSGHAYRDEQAQMLTWCRPRYFVPLHGERRQLESHARLAEAHGAQPFVIENGEGLWFHRHGEHVEAERAPAITLQPRYLDGSGTVDEVVLRDRLALAETGFAGCTILRNARGQAVGPPALLTRGVFHLDREPELLDDARAALLDAVGTLNTNANNATWEEALRSTLRRYFRQRLNRRPVVIATVVDMGG